MYRDLRLGLYTCLNYMITYQQIFNITKPWHIRPGDLEIGDVVLCISKYNEGVRFFPKSYVIDRRYLGKFVRLALGGAGRGHVVQTEADTFSDFWVIVKQLD